MSPEEAEIQAAHLALWGTKLRPELFAEVKAFVIASGKPYRGQDLIEIIRQWPDLKEPYRISPVNNPLDEV